MVLQRSILWIFTICGLPICFLSVQWSLFYQTFTLWLLLFMSHTICLHAIFIARLWVPRGKECEHFLSCTPSLQHRSWPMGISGSKEEKINIPFPVYYLFGESSLTFIIQFFWHRWSLPLLNTSLEMDSWPKLGHLKLCPAFLQEIGAWRHTHPPPLKIYKDIVRLKQLLAIFATPWIGATWVWNQHKN